MSDIPLKEIPVALGPVTTVLREGNPLDPAKILLIDVETTGFSPKVNEIIELAAAEMLVCKEEALVYTIRPLFDHFKEPTRSVISPRITEITGITPERVKGKKLDIDVVLKAFSRADLVVPHNAKFDKGFLEVEFPQLVEDLHRWACSCHDVKWLSRGFPNKKLGDIIKHLGYKFSAHRAIADVVATGWALHCSPEALREVLDVGFNQSFKLKYSGVPKEHNTILKDRDYAYSGGSKTWSRNIVSQEELVQEFSVVDTELNALNIKFQREVSQVSPTDRWPTWV